MGIATTDCKSLLHRKDATDRFEKAASLARSEQLLHTALFEASGTEDVRPAVEAVKIGRSLTVALLDTAEPFSVALEKQPKGLDL